ncbi:formylglycine-generating enzyme family protein [Luteolibacter sp. Populi]|uniref:formylglycine-generating enzyme family protein n=1 Tax=Luteolibacter sp. Populi TaxID=3230487 RepID=UPI003467C36B
MKAPLLGLTLCLIACSCPAAEPVLKLDLGNGVGLDLVLIPAGGYVQGSPADEAGRASDETQRIARISHDFYIGRSAVTRAQWERFIAETRYKTESEVGSSGGYGWNGRALEQRKDFTWKNPGFPQTPDHPVSLLTFPDAQAFCAWLEKKTGRKVTLPTEAQWEYACRAGTTGPWHGEDAYITGWHKENAGDGTRPVGSKPPNPWGLFIAGNVSEWCLDWYGPYPEGPATDPLQQNPNLSDKPRRVLRGGSWLRGVSNTRSAARYRADPRSRNADTGFRIVCGLEAAQVAQVTPPVEVESSGRMGQDPPPADNPPPSRQTPAFPESGGSTGVALVKGLACILIPFAIIFTLIRRALRRKQDQAPPPPPSDSFLRRTPGGSVVRKVDDGFWVHGDWPEGTPLTLRYVVAGVALVQEILYRPGSGGQFVYTGNTPDTISVLAGSDPTNTTEPGLFTGPSITQGRDRDDDNDRPSRPPTSPSAY